ncbi:MAG: hypothetical protein ACFCVD_17130 [Nodosilinea sp.]
MNQVTPSLYLERLLNLYDERRRRFQVWFTLLVVGTLLLFFFVVIPYFTLLGNRLDCQLNNAQCSQIEAALLNERLTQVTTSWGNIPISTAEVVALSPLLYAVGFAAVAMQLHQLMQLRQGIDRQTQREALSIDTSLVTPLLLDRRHWGDFGLGLAALLTPPLLCLYTMRLIYLRRGVLRLELPYAQSARFYLLIYAVSAGLIGFSLLRLLFGPRRQDE